ncbi:hypothetical protein [Vibrio natriegens]|uniref:hypothetical protein n=1 Tax=Vibrio natriegens TaxID=691 RepID=UPI001EFC6FD5|nr:hypothetical protein [Vibrio natriegens]
MTSYRFTPYWVHKVGWAHQGEGGHSADTPDAHLASDRTAPDGCGYNAAIPSLRLLNDGARPVGGSSVAG